jgi:hypothetical protein
MGFSRVLENGYYGEDFEKVKNQMNKFEEN